MYFLINKTIGKVYNLPIQSIYYLEAAGVANITRAISNPIFPLNESICKYIVKLYYNDVGILTTLLYENNLNAVLNNGNGINLGFVYETAFAMELIAHGHKLFYFDNICLKILKK